MFESKLIDSDFSFQSDHKRYRPAGQGGRPRVQGPQRGHRQPGRKSISNLNLNLNFQGKSVRVFNFEARVNSLLAVSGREREQFRRLGGGGGRRRRGRNINFAVSSSSSSFLLAEL